MVGSISGYQAMDKTYPIILLPFSSIKMAFWRKSDGLVAQGYANFQKMVWKCKIAIHTNFWKFEYPCATRYADFIGLSPKPHLNKSKETFTGKNHHKTLAST